MFVYFLDMALISLASIGEGAFIAFWLKRFGDRNFDEEKKNTYVKLISVALE